jgi:hypothetical protein
MPYNLSLSNGAGLTTLQDGAVDTTSTSLTLIGKNYPGYGTFLNENFIQLLENFASSTGPANPLPGQLWWDSTLAVLKINAATSPGSPIWKIISSSTSSSSAPSAAITGDLWWDTANSQLKVYGGSSWVTIGPAFTASTGTSGAIADTITGIDGPHVVVKFLISNTLVAILSKDSPFTPVTPITGFSGTIKPGFNFSNQSPALIYYGDSNSALNLKIGGDLIPASSFLRSDVSTPSTTKIQVQTDDGLDIGATGQLSINVSGSEVRVINNANGFDTAFYSKVSSVNTKVLTLSGTDGLLTVRADPTASLGIATKNYVDTANVNLSQSVNARIAANIATTILRDGSTTVQGNIVAATSNVFSLGSSTTFYANVFAQTFRGTAITAQYADLAERFASDQPYEAGTVVMLGGTKEITSAVDELSDDVFGVISEKAAFLMNDAAGGNDTHPPVAVNGRVPVKVIGRVRKGDRLVAAGNGLARSGAKNELTPWNVIGRSLEDKSSSDEGFVEAIVKLNS